MKRKLVTVDAETLLATPMSKTMFIVDGLIPQGVNVLSGAAKIGKSWLMLWLGLQVSQGLPVWGIPTMHCDVLYLCLEDTQRRIKDRLFDLTNDPPRSFHLTVTCGLIGNGLEEEIINFLEDFPKTKLVIIDTLQKVRDSKGSTGKTGMYGNDYDDISAIKRIADEHDISIITELHPFKDHPFKIQNDDEMKRLIESIQKFGTLTPALARPLPEGGYELISGHRRLAACQVLEFETMPVIVREMSDDEAVIAMVDANLQREHILPSEKAFAYKMKLDAIKHQAVLSKIMERTAKNRVLFGVGTKKEKSRNPHGYWIFRWRSGWDSNPRAREDYLISSQARYDHFDTAPYMLSRRFFPPFSGEKGLWKELTERTANLFNFRTG